MRFQDLRVAARVIAKNPLPTALSALSITLGIGLTSAVFSVADALMLRPLAIERPSEVWRLDSRGDDGAWMMYTWRDYENMRDSGAGIAGIAAFQRRGGLLANAEGSESVLVSPCTPNYFSLLGVKAIVGRASVEPVMGRPAAVLGWRLWQRRFGGDPAIAGKTIVLGGKALTAAGVLPAEFGGLTRGVANDIWVSTDAWFDVLERGSRRAQGDQFEMILRLKAGVNPEAAQAQLDASIRGPGKRKPAPAGSPGTMLEAPFATGWTKGLVFGGGLIAILGLVLFVACANVAQLRLAQAEAHKKEIAVRVALGAGSGRIVGQLLTETALIAVPGAALGLWFAHVLLRKAVEFITAGQTFIDPGVRLDTRVLMFTFAATCFSVLVTGVAPARHALRTGISEVLKGQQATAGARTRWPQRALVMGQAAVAVAMFGTALLFIQSLWNASAIRPGFDPGKKLLIASAVRGSDMPVVSWCEQACERLAALPGVRAATYARRLPLGLSGGGATARIEMPHQPPRAVKYNNVGGNYFAVMDTRLVAGRGIDANDRKNTTPVVVVSRMFAQQFLPGLTPLGESIPIDKKIWQVVGVVEDGPSNHLHENPEPYLYFAYAQKPADDVVLILDAAVDAASLARPMRDEMKRFDSRALLTHVETLREHMRFALAGDHLMGAVASITGGFSIALMAAGLFGVLQYTVTRRMRELGVRVALGATARNIMRIVLAEALLIAACGIPPGVGLLVALGLVMRSAVIGVSPLDPALHVASATGVLVLLLVAAWLPARRATRVDPVEALRSE